jgi:hypothetical protein
MYEYIGILLGVPPILHISRIKVKEDGKNKEDIIQRMKEAKVMFNNKTQFEQP